MDAQDSNTLGIVVSTLTGGLLAWGVGLPFAHTVASYAVAEHQASYLAVFAVAACLSIPCLEALCTLLAAACWRWRLPE